jgi:AcrR family transcriptional regulator
MPPPKLQTRERIVEAACDVFSRQGYSASVDAVADAAGVAKPTLYSHFASKDEVVRAVVDDHDARWMDRLERAIGEAPDATGRLLAVFDVVARDVGRRGFRGCPVLTAAAELPSREHPAREACARHKRAVRGRLAELAAEAGSSDPKALATQVALLVDGALGAALVTSRRSDVDAARTAARTLVSASTTDR